MILVTGGAGFIGSVLAKELNNSGREDIVIVDRLKDGQKWLNLRGIKFDQYIFADDLFDGTYDDVLGEISCIYHMGACSATTERDVDYLMRNNVDYSKSLFNLAVQNDVPFIYASSAATYGEREEGFTDSHSEIKNLKALNPYGWSKQLFDEWVLRQEVKPKHWYGLKFFNVYGPNEYHKGSMRSIVQKSFEQIKESGQVKLFKSHRDDFEDGKQLRDFIYVLDVCMAMMQMSLKENAKGSGIYNLGTGTARSFYDLVVATFKALDKEVNIEFIDMPESIRNQYQYYTQAEMDKFKKQFPEFKFHSLEEGVTDYVKNYLNTSNPYY